ncbi:MAG: ABC transporter permease [Micrococcales bacterium]|uniref:ABC transporter permease n=1 Tax=Phycicoccus sp. TaxID=1902410 RepID=UPI0019B48F0F|nr:ABC transporter permease [Phycicoccus sp.]MBD3781430.1 ABC transporter permease [Micrococcales bacterium]HMM95439.1 ABC transporter permease [Phycicoccus sp.]
MGTYILRRLLQMIPVILGATFLIFAMVFALPGDPLAGKCGERPCSAAYRAAFTEKYNLNDPLLVQYGKYVGKLATGDFGETYNQIKVSDQLKQRYPVTAKLALMAILFETLIGIVAGVLTGVRRGGFLDNLVLVSTLVVISIPVFVIGGLAQYFLGVKWGLFPVTVTSGEATVYQLLLPAMVLGSLSVAYVARLTRTNLVENLRSDYVRTAISKGLTKRRAIGLHALRNSLIPVVTFIGFDFGALLGGAIVTESIFNIPGIGGYIFRSIRSRDGASVVGAVTVLVIVYLVVNLIVDLLYGLLDPRISHD